MKRLKTYQLALLIALFASLSSLQGQRYQLLGKSDKSAKVRFELINNLMVIPMEVNGTKLSFLLDTGVSTPILFNLSDSDSLELNNVSKISIRGLGTGEAVEALKSDGNTFRLSSLINPNQQVYVVLDREMNFSPTLGIPIHGIIGYDLFKDYVVEVNYARRFLRFYEPEAYREREDPKAMKLPLEIEDRKAYLQAGVMLQDGEELTVKLLMDTGSSDAVWLFQGSEDGLEVPQKHYDDYLGKGLSGSIYGKRTKVKQIRLGEHVLEDAKAAFPDMESFWALSELSDRDGSAGGELLKRFNMVVNYPDGEITLQKNAHFTEPFHFNMAGIEIEHAGMRYIAERITDNKGVVLQDEEDTFGTVQILTQSQTRLSLVPEIVVSAIRAGSPAAEVGLQEGDVILAVNGKSVHHYKLQEVMKMINEKKGKRVRLLIERLNNDLLFSFVLREVFE